MLHKIIPATIVCASTLLLSACGGGGGGSSDTSKDNTAGENARFSQEIANVVSFLALDVVEVPTLRSPFEGESPRIRLGTFTGDNPGECGGSDTETRVVTGVGEDQYPYKSDDKTVYTDYCFNIGTYEFVRSGESGRITEQTDASNGTSERFVNFSYVSDFPSSEEYSLSYLAVSTLVNGVETVQIESSYTPPSGVTYRLDTYDTSGDAINGYIANGSFIDDDGQRYVMALSGLQDCNSEARGDFGAGGGTITTDNGDVIDIRFDNCFRYTLTYKGVATTYPAI